MGRRLAGLVARQRSHLIDSSPGWARIVLLAVLAFDGVLSAIAGAFLLPSYLGAIPLPVSGLVSGAVNAALVWAALQWAPTARAASIPLWSWVATVLVLTLGGPGGDIVLGGAGIMQLAPIIFMVLGAGPPAFVLFRLTAKANAGS